MNNFKPYDILESILGSFSPEQMSVFMNQSVDVDIEENYLTLFHERFHHWQYIFTPYGHLKWGSYRSISADVINIWLDSTNATPEERRIPINYLLEKGDKVGLQGAAGIYFQEMVLKMIILMERNYLDRDIETFFKFNNNDICPQIVVGGQKYALNGIDIIECFAKYQEAILGYIVEKKNFKDIMDPCLLRSEYYMTYQYFIEQVGNDRIMEFPVVCELALSTNKLCKFDDLHSWKQNHPAWRFVEIINCLKNFSDIIYLHPSNLKDKYRCYCNQILEKCNFEKINTIWDSASKYAQQADLSMAGEMLRAIDFKKEHEWILAYPFMAQDLHTQKELYSFQPYFYIYNDATIYTSISNSLTNEVIFENNFQAFSHQIRGNISARYIFKDELQCGFSYFGLSGCKYLECGTCQGSIKNISEIEELEFDENYNVIKGCTFELFLNVIGTSIRKICIGDLSKKVSLQQLSEYAKNHNTNNY